MHGFLATEMAIAVEEPVCVPGEIYPELVYGTFQEPVDKAADFPDASLEPHLTSLRVACQEPDTDPVAEGEAGRGNPGDHRGFA